MEYSRERFARKVAVVTGAASGIGEAITRRLVAEGASVVGGDLNLDALSRLADELGTSFLGAPADVREESAAEALVEAALEHFGHLHAAFNVAGLARGGPIIDIDMADWDLQIAVCLTGVIQGMKHQARAMKAGGGGAIVNVASLNSRVPAHGGVAYCASKAGVAMLSQVGAIELADYGIRVNTVSPGLTATNFDAGRGARDPNPKIMASFIERIPIGRAAQPSEIAAACVWLASDDASYVSGVNLFADGGWEQSAYPDTRADRAR